MRNELILRVTLTPSFEDAPAPEAVGVTREYRFSKLPIEIGRSPGNDIEICSQFVSSHHVRIEEVSGTLCVRDLASRNGVIVLDDGTRIPANTAYPVPPTGFALQLGNEARLRVEPAPLSARHEAGAHAARALSHPALGDVLPLLPDLPRPLRPLPPLDSSADALELDGHAPCRAALPERKGAGFEPLRPEPRRRGQPEAAPVLKTGGFDLSPEALALQGLREIVGSLTPGRALETNGDIARLIARLHDILQVICRNYSSLRAGHSSFVAQLQLQRSAGYGPTSAALDSARDPAAVAALLLDFREHAMSPAPALDTTLREMAVHQVALLDGVMQGVQALLDELAPARLEREEALSRVFGAEFASAYRAYRRSHPPR